QWAQDGATAWIAHSKLSKIMARPSAVTSWNDLSYSLPHTSHLAMAASSAARLVARHGALGLGFRPALRRALPLDFEADLAVDAIHGDLVILDDALGVLDPERADAAQGARCLPDCLAAGIVEALLRLGDHFDRAHDGHRNLPASGRRCCRRCVMLDVGGCVRKRRRHSAVPWRQ